MEQECFHYTASVINFHSNSTTGFSLFDLCDSKSYTNSLGIWQVCHQITFKGTDHLFLPLAGNSHIFSTDFEIECLNFSGIEEPTLSIHSLKITTTFRRPACPLLLKPDFACQLLHCPVYIFRTQG